MLFRESAVSSPPRRRHSEHNEGAGDPAAALVRLRALLCAPFRA
eukprot:gene49874-37646_t